MKTNFFKFSALALVFILNCSVSAPIVHHGQTEKNADINCCECVSILKQIAAAKSGDRRGYDPYQAISAEGYGSATNNPIYQPATNDHYNPLYQD